MTPATNVPAASTPPPMFSTLIASRPTGSIVRTAPVGVAAIIFHAVLAVGLVYATRMVGMDVEEEEEMALVELPEATPPPPPPPPPDIAGPPPVVNVGFQTLTVPDVVLSEIPPPNYDLLIREADFTGRGVEGSRANAADSTANVAAAPVFTPREVEPELRNRDEVAAALQRAYPAMLRDAGVGGTAILWFFINEQGTVVDTRVDQSSGYPALDQAATEVGGIMRFTPALNRDEAVPVWVQIPIEFRPVTQ